MVLENVVIQVLNKFLGDYVENLDKNQLSLGIWGGSVELKNLVFKRSALDDLNLPIKITYGQIGELILKIPWKNLYGEPLVISVKDVYLVASPSSEIQYDAKKEEELAFQAKQSELQKVTDAKKAAAEKGKSATDSTFVEKLITQIVNNIQLYIKHVHIRYEDKSIDPTNPFSLGVTLNDLHLASTDENWKPALTKTDVSKIFKVVQLEGLSVYWNSRSSLYMNLPIVELVKKLQQDIASKSQKPAHYTYLLGPINASSRLKINKKPESDQPAYTIPKLHLNFDIEKLFIGITKNQYRDIIALADSFDRMSKAQRFRKYRPQVPGYKGYYKEWWHFAINCVLIEEVQRQKRNWDWNNMKNHRDLCKEYGELYRKKLKNSAKSDEKERITHCEKMLDVVNLVIIREKAELEFQRQEQQKPVKSGWTSWFWGGSKSDSQEDLSDTNKIMKQFEAAMTPEEKGRLYRAIDYQEGGTITEFPETFIDKTCTFVLRTLEIELCDEDAPIKRVLLTELTGVKCRLDTREGAKAIIFRVKIDQFMTFGLQQKEFIPKLITSTQEVERRGLLEVFFETNPLDKSCNQRVHVSANPLKVIYDGQTINKLVEIFTVPPSSSLDQLAEKAEQRFSDMKDFSSLGLQHVIESHTVLDIKIDFKAPYIIIPHGGKYTEKENVIVVNLGNFKFQSVERQDALGVRELYRQGKKDTEILEQMKARSYDEYKLELSDLQILVADASEKWLDSINKVTNVHILNPLGIQITLAKCLIRDPQLPAMKISGQLDSLNLNVTDVRLFMILDLVTSLPLPKSTPAVDPAPKRLTRRHSSSIAVKYSEMQGKVLKMQSKLGPKVDETVQFTSLDANFIIKEFSLNIRQQTDLQAPVIDFLSFKALNLETALQQQTRNVRISTRLGGIFLKQFREGDNNDINIISTPGFEENSYLFVIKFIQVDKASPDFHSTYNSCESALILEFKRLKFILHQEGLSILMAFANDLQESLQKRQIQSSTTVVDQRDRIGSAISGRESLQRRLSSLSESIKIDTGSKKKSTLKVIDSILFKITANLEEVSAELTSDKHRISMLAVRGLESDLILKTSYTAVSAKLKNICIIDLNPSTSHNLIISCPEEENAIDLKIVKYNTEQLVDKPDLAIELGTGTLRIIFLNLFVSRMLNFLNNFQEAQETMAEASRTAAQSAKDNMQLAYAKATKLSLNIRLKAPVLYVPADSNSFSALVLDLGFIDISNSFINLEVKDPEGHPAVIDDLVVSLTKLKASRVEMDKNYKAIAESQLFEPVNVIIKIKRNLSISWYTGIPALDIVAKFGTLMLLLNQADYQMVMDVVNKNLAEAEPPESRAVAKPKLDRPSETAVKSTEAILESGPAHMPAFDKTAKVHTFLNLTFTVENIGITLFKGGQRSLLRDSPTKSTPEGLCRFSLEGISLKCRIMSDNCIVTSLLLVNCILDDLRTGREQKITRFLSRCEDREIESSSPNSSTKNVSEVALRSMIDVTVQIRENNFFIDTRVYSFTFILSVDFLLKLSEFFTARNANTASIEPVPVPKGKAKVAVQAKQEEATPSTNNITLNLKIEKPDIVLVEHMDNEDTKSLILNTEVLVKLRLADGRQVINGQIKDFHLYTSVFSARKRPDSRYSVLSPITISLAGSTVNDGGLHVELLMTDIHLRVSPATIQLLNSVVTTATSRELEAGDTPTELNNHSDLWDMKPFNENKFWFLRADEAQEAVDFILVQNRSRRILLQELCILSVPSIVITVEAGVGQKTLPMLLLEASLKGFIRNWSSQLRIEIIFSLQMGYYNSRLALWEPLIEPIELVKDQKVISQPWELKMEIAMNDPEATSPGDSDEGTSTAAMTIDISSENNLELSITKTSLDVLNNLGAAFASAMVPDVTSAMDKGSSCQFVNELGSAVTLLLSKGSFKMSSSREQLDVILQDNTTLPLAFKSVNAGTAGNISQRLTFRKVPVTSQFLHVKVNETKTLLDLPVVQADKRFFPLNYRGDTNDQWGIISDIKVEDGVTIVTVRSILQVYNHFNAPIDVYYMTPRGNELALIASIKPGATLNVPLHAVYTPTNELFFSVDGYSVTTTPYVWKDLQTNLSVGKTLKCNPKDVNRGSEPFIVKVYGEMEQVYFENTSKCTLLSTCYNIHLRPAVLFKNLLPIKIICCVENVAGETELEAGCQVLLGNVNRGNSCVIIRLPEYLEREWSCRQEIANETSEFSVWSFYSYDSTVRICLDLGMHAVVANGSLILSLYCPFWMLNKTDLSLVYSADETMNFLPHPANFKGPVLFSFPAKNFFGKKKASIRIENGQWSDKFSLDVAGSSGVIGCISEGQIYQIGVSNQLTYNGLTKQITFTPYYVIINNATFAIECQESERPADPWIRVEPETCAPLWPRSTLDNKLLRLRVAGTEEVSAPFLYTESHNTLLKLKNQYGGVNVDIQLTEGGIYINIASYEHGMAPALIVNNTRHAMNFWEKESVQLKKLAANNCMLYTWDNPTGSRILVWEADNKKELLNDLRKDAMGEYTVADYQIYWVSFLDGMQRVLFFTEVEALAENAQASNLLEAITQEITVSIHGIGLSVVNNMTHQEIMYLCIASSGVIWEHRKVSGRRYKPFNNKDNMVIEGAYQRYVLDLEKGVSPEGSSIIDNKMEVDFNTGYMAKPNKRYIRRRFQTGLWLQMKSSPSQLQLHGKINRIQIDNQMRDCMFPVVFAPVPPPKSVAIDRGIKPFAELSIVQLLVKNSQIKQFKYFKMLVQEFHVKVDLGFVTSLIDCFTTNDETDEEEKKKFLTDANLVNTPLFEHVSSHSQKEQKSFYDVLHFSPLKAHVSFSLAGGSSTSTAQTPNFLNVLLQGIGVTLTDMQDVIFKLAYFQREYTFLTQKQLISEAMRHYVGQTVKQLYVLVLGLDVIGNPYGLVIGITKGVEDLFYEPFQGAIQGPGEFAEGLAYGVRSLFGHTVGGAAGAVSRITGVMGKGVAMLTFDEDYQKKRQDQINKRPATVQEGIARSGKGLVMGVVDGVTGVFTKPISGAKEEGVGGFFKGLGKGAVGLVARPTSGVVDFASGSLAAVKRATDTSEEITRLRNPRFLQADGQVRPYNPLESFGYKLLLDTDKGNFAKTDTYVYHYDVISNREVLLLTDQRLVYATYNELFGSWQSSWSYTWQELKHPATIVPKGISISTDSKKKTLGIFGSSDNGKIILISNTAMKEELVQKIESLRVNA